MCNDIRNLCDSNNTFSAKYIEDNSKQETKKKTKTKKYSRKRT